MRQPLILSKLLIHSGLARWLPGVQSRLGDGTDYLRYFSDRLLASPLRQLEEAANELQEISAEVIDLAHGAPAFDVLPSASTKLPADRRGWPPFAGLTELRDAVAEKLRHENGLGFNPATEVLITAGALGAVQTVLDAFVNAGDYVVLFDPCSPLYSLLAAARRAKIRWLPTWMEEGRTRFRFDQLARALRKARLLVLNSPVNPTGGTIAAADREEIAWWAERHDVLILSDESFACYSPEDSSIRFGTMPRARQRTLTAGSVSQSYALASARVGWLAAHRPLLRPCLLTAALRSPFVPTLCQQLALSALRVDASALAPIYAEFASRRRYSFERLSDMDLHPTCPSGGFFLWVPVWEQGVSGRCFAERLLRERQVRVTAGDLFGPSGKGYVRISCAIDDCRLQEGLNRLAEFVASEPDRAVAPPRNLAA